jgi:hypothetical protein
MVLASADAVAEGARNPQDDSDDDEDHADGPQDADSGDEADDERNDAEDDHGVLRFRCDASSRQAHPRPQRAVAAGSVSADQGLISDVASGSGLPVRLGPAGLRWLVSHHG